MAVLRRELGLEAKIWLLTVVVAAAAVGAYLGLVEPLGTGPSELDVPWWLVAAGFAAAERWVVHLHFRRSTHSLSLGELPLVAGLLFLPAHELVIAGLVGSSIALAFDREIPTFKAFFNLAQFTLGTWVAHRHETHSTRLCGSPSSVPCRRPLWWPTSAWARP